MSETSPENPSFSGVGSKRAGTVSIPAGLYLVPTPIGNLRDVTLRAMDVLAAAGVIACEDTRVTRRLLSALGIPAPTLWTYNDHSNPSVSDSLLQRAEAGEVVAVVADAGTPAISDPGYRLMVAAAARNVPVTALPGPSAVLPALSLSGLPTDRFAFLGFLPSKAAARRRSLRAVAHLPMTLVFFESPHRLTDSLADMTAELGDRAAAVCRELSKIHEEALRGPLSELAVTLAARERVRGEIVVVVAGASDNGEATDEGVAAEALDQELLVALQGSSVKTAAAMVAGKLGLPKRDVYQRALSLRATPTEEPGEV